MSENTKDAHKTNIEQSEANNTQTTKKEIKDL